mmetsp:Transcript_42198/g.78973  ORF Transcript_42198/g.78973 Transcript_42198/m.78973 type:complete len:405 (-) Transcript_42198:154-1368(-)
MADVTMHSPVPRKPFMERMDGSPCTPSYVEELRNSRPLHYDTWGDEVADELRQVFSGKSEGKQVLPDWLPAFRSPAASSMASTSAGPTPGLDDTSPLQSISPPLSPECIDPSSESLMHSQSFVSEKSCWMQERKVFVGGIPQYMGQSDLYKMFNKFAKVKKAWLQLMHFDSRTRQVPTMKKHRGFGFVIFCEKCAVDRLLGDAFSRMISLDENVQVEIKRAVGKMGTAPATPDPYSSEGHRNVGSSNAASPELQTPWRARALSFNSCDNLPYVPPFPADPESETPLTICDKLPYASSETQWPGNNNEALPFMKSPILPAGSSTAPGIQASAERQWPGNNNEALSSLPFSAMPHPPAVSPAAHATQATAPFLPGVLLNGLVGPQPRDTLELISMLQQAMPDHYDD